LTIAKFANEFECKPYMIRNSHPLISSRADWHCADLAADRSWARHLTSDHIAEVTAALHHARQQNLKLGEFFKAEFPLPELSKILAEMQNELQEGLGFSMLRGFPVDQFDEHELRLIFWGIGSHIDQAVSQSKFGDVLGDVQNMGSDTKKIVGRGYRSNAELTFHGDSCDITGLFCLRTSKSGGLSRLSSSLAAHNEIARQRPDLLELLYQPFVWSRRGEALANEEPTYQQPIFGGKDRNFVCRYLRPNIKFGYEVSSLEMTEQQEKALDYFDDLINDPEFFFEKEFAPGDIQFSNNFKILHSRTEFEDFEEPEKRRHLLRLWLSPPNSPPLPKDFEVYFRDIRAGAVRGGYKPLGETTFATTENE